MRIWDYMLTFAKWLKIVGTTVEPEEADLLPQDLPATILNERYSYRDFTGLDFTKIDPKEFDKTIITGTCFSQLLPLTKVFPPGMTGVLFMKCNLDNVDIPVGNTMDACCNRQWKEQNDMELWVVDIALQPVEPLSKKMFQDLGISINPANIPVEKMDMPITAKKMEDSISAGVIR